MSPSPKPADSSRDGCRKGILIAHGFTIEDMVALVRADLAIATADRVMAGGARSRSGGCGSRKQGGGGSNAFTEIAVGYPMPENENRGPHLRTKYVFIDTQAFRRARFDWDGRIPVKARPIRQARPSSSIDDGRNHKRSEVSAPRNAR